MQEQPAITCKGCGGLRAHGKKCAPCHAAYQRQYRLTHGDQVRATKRESAKRRHADGYRRDADKQRAYSAVQNPRYYRATIVDRLVRNANARALNCGVPFAITAADICIPDVCPVLGIPIAVADGGGFQPGSPSLDRIIPQLGYVPGNIAVISNRANILKRNATLAELEALTAWLKAQS